MATPIVRRFHALGVALQLETNSHALATLMEGLFPPREHTHAAPLPGAPSAREPMLLRADVGGDATPPSEQPHGPATATHVRDGKLFVSIGGSTGVADRAAGVASAVITPDMALDGARVQTCFLEPLALFIACRERPVTLHAAAVVHNGRCVLLTGRHGAGKSTLAYACVRAGFGLLAEDIVFSGPTSGNTRMFWGRPSFLHLLPDAIRFFPELANAPIVQQFNGELKIRVDAEARGAAVDSAPEWDNVLSLRSAPREDSSTVWGVCSLSRSEADGPRILDADKAEIKDALTRFEGDPLLDQVEMESAAERLLRGRIAHLDVGRDPIQAVDVLRRWLDAE